MNKTCFVCFLIVGALVARNLDAQDAPPVMGDADLLSKLEEQEARIAALESTALEPHEAARRPTGTCGAFEPYAHSSGLVFDAEAAFLKFQGPSALSALDVDFEVSPRMTLGYVGEGGLGIRTRYWQWDHDFAFADPPVTRALSVDTYNIDLELFEAFGLNRNWTIEVSGGLRYNEFDLFRQFFLLPGTFVQNTNLNSDSIGVLAGLEAKRFLGRWASLFVGARGALLAADEDVLFTHERTDIPQSALFRRVEDDVARGMWELRLGFEARRTLADRSYLFVRGAAEYDLWMNFDSTPARVTDPPDLVVTSSDPTDAGFFGSTISIGLAR